MKYKILSILCVLCLLAGCKVELPPQDASSAIASSASSFEASLPQSESASASSSQSATVSSAVSSAVAPKAAAPGVTSKSASSKPAATKTPTASKSSSPPIEQSCTLFISCSDILKNKDKFSADKLAIVPADGLIYGENSIHFEDGDTVFDVLVREMKANQIQMEYASSPVNKTNYIKGIDNIYEKDFGGTSGWMYAVNGKQPPVGCSSYKLKSGDKIQWLYICGQ